MSTQNKLEKLGHVAFIAMCLVVTAAGVQYVLAARSAAAGPARTPPVAEGTTLPLPPDATGGGRAPGLLLVLSTSCRFCEDSMPFYVRLAALPAVESGALRMSVVSLQPVATMEQYLEPHGLRVSSILTVPQSGFNVMGTPALVIVGRDGVVRESWSGWLNAEEEKTVIAALARAVEDEGSL
jgi:hypothetical protein